MFSSQIVSIAFKTNPIAYATTANNMLSVLIQQKVLIHQFHEAAHEKRTKTPPDNFLVGSIELVKQPKI
jgi:hypothetical protein